ncbi:MAG TPA: hypothetical protein ENJ33_02375 [Thiothrix sp.]|nr:hypothetical protein [Thiothrix sp.]
MLSNKASLSTRVEWVRQETEQQLSKTTRYLENYAAFDENALVDHAHDIMQDIEKTMNAIGVQGGATLSQEIRLLLIALRDNKVGDTQATLKVLHQAVSQLSEYLQHLQDGYADLPIVMLPLLNELRAARGVELLSELLVFLPEEDDTVNKHLDAYKRVSLSVEKRSQIYKHLRMHFQKALLTWFKDSQADHALKTMQAINNDLIRIHNDVNMRIFWWVAQALILAIRAKKLEVGIAVKLLIGNLDRQLAKESQQCSEAFVSTAELQELKRNLLYYIGLAEKGIPLVDAVKEVYRLDIYLPQGESLQKLRKHYTSPGQQLWKAVSATVKDDMQSIMEGFESMERDPDEGIMRFIIDKSRKTATTLRMLGLGRLATIVNEQVDEFKVLIDQPRQFTAERRIEVATEWLRVQDILEQYAETGEDATQVLFTNDGHYQVSDYSARKALFTILTNDLEKVIDSLNSFEKNTEDDELEFACQFLGIVENTLAFLNLSELLPLAKGGLSYIRQAIVDKTLLQSKHGLARLADVLVSLESSLLSLRNCTDHLFVLEDAYQNLRQLHQQCHLYNGIEEEISLVLDEVARLKKQIRQNKMESILAA